MSFLRNAFLALFFLVLDRQVAVLLPWPPLAFLRRDVTGTKVAWRLKTHVGKYASPILIHGLLYTAAEESFVTCLEAVTGQTIWTERIGGKYTASPVYADNRLYFLKLQPAQVQATARLLAKDATVPCQGAQPQSGIQIVQGNVRASVTKIQDRLVGPPDGIRPLIRLLPSSRPVFRP